MKRIVAFMLTLLLCIHMPLSLVVAESNPSGSKTIQDIIGDPTPEPIGESLVGAILGSFQYVAYAIAIGMLIYFGIKYVISAADERADLKKGFVKYIIGAVLIAAAFTIVNMVYNHT